VSVAAVVNRFRACRGSLELFAFEGKAAQELLESNPLAGFCLAVNDQFRPPPPVCPLAAAAHMLWKPQREILAWLGFPGTEAVAKLGRKCLPESLTLHRCLRLRRSLRDETVRSLLAHLPRINGGVMDLITRRDGTRNVTPQLLAEVAQNRQEDGIETSAVLLEDARRMARLLRRQQELERIRTRQQLRELHDEMVHDYMQRRQTRAAQQLFPPPPIPGKTTEAGSIIPITTREQLVKLGREQHNCVASYASQILHGRVYIYRVTCGTEVCTLSLEWHKDGRWELQQIKTVCNREPSLAATALVEDWLRGEGVARETGLAPEAVAPAEPPAMPPAFPNAPLPGTTENHFAVTAVASVADLPELGLDGFHTEFLCGRICVYQVNSPEGLFAVMLRRDDGRPWRLERVVPLGSQPLRGETIQAVADWLQRAQRKRR